MYMRAIPVLHVGDSRAASSFYCGKLGFSEKFAYRFDDKQSDPCYMGLIREDVVLHFSSFSGDAVSGGAVFIVVENVDELYEEFRGTGVDVQLPPTDQSWGNREMYVEDPDGNSLRFVHFGK